MSAPRSVAPSGGGTPTRPPAGPPPADEFFVGYDPPLPPGVARTVRRAVLALGAGALLAAAGLAAGHTRLDGGAFDFGRPAPAEGLLVEHPYPALLPDAPGAGVSPILLVAPGKHGAAALVLGLDGKRVAFDGTRIARGPFGMLEVDPGSLRASATRTAARPQLPPPARRSAALVTLRGEIVDSKCFLGVMVPGAGRTHRACAALCLRGGIPPALHVTDADGRSTLLLLLSPTGGTLAPLVHALAGHEVEVTGRPGRLGTWVTLATDPGSWRRARR